MITPLSKVIEINFNLTETINTLLANARTGKQFNTADTDAWFEFGFTDANIQNGTFNLTLINLKDESKFEHEGIAFNSNPFYYKLDSGADMQTNEIKHAGTWIGQLVVTLANGKSATQKFMFDIESHILDGTVASVTMLEGYSVLMAQIENAKELLDQYNIDYAALLADLEAIYNSRLFSVEQQLEQGVTKQAEEINSKFAARQVSAIRNKQPLVLFTDDDGNKAIMTKLKPISEDTGVPFSVCLLVSVTEDGSGISLAEAKYLQDTLGWEISSHGYSDIGLGNELLTDVEIEHQVLDSLIYFRERGLDVKNYVYPGGQASTRARQIVSKYVNAVLGTGTAPNTYPLMQFNINRLPFPGDVPNNTLDYYKSKVDEAVANNQMLVWMLHCGMENFDATQQQHLRDLIAYIKTLNVDMPTVQGAIDKVGNIIDINDRQFYMSADGTNNMVNTIIQNDSGVDGSDIVKISDLPNSFERNKVTVSLVNNSRNLTPSGRGGCLITNALTTATYVSQTFIDQGGRQFNRHSITDTTWSPFTAVTISKSVITASIVGRTLAAGSSFWTVIENGTILSDDAHIAQPVGTLELGLTWNCWSHGNAAAILEIYNPTTAPIVMANRDFRIHHFS